jgi:2-amino-4-hydroxy-6-hydroxymethyldihydropteridine diphosphokinase
MYEVLADNADGLTVVALGGNLPGAFPSIQAGLDAALERLAEAGLSTVEASRWWRSAAWPDPADPPFLNGVALVRTDLAAEAVFDILQGVEHGFGPRSGVVNAPRALDLDLIASGRRVLYTPRLVVPHPRAADRYFVMGPLAEIAPHWRHPVSLRTAAQLAETATVGRDARPIEN